MRKLLVALGGLFLCLSAVAQNSTGTQTLTVANAGCVSGSCVLLKFDSNEVASASISLSGVFTATVQFEASSDGLALTDANKVWVAINGTPLNGTTGVSSATTANTWKFNVASLTDIRARASAWTSAPTVVIKSSKGDPAQVAGGGAVTTTSGTASAITQAGYPMICDSATSGTVTAGQAQMVRCNTAGAISIAAAAQNSDAVSASIEGGVTTANATAAPLQVAPKLYNGSTFSRAYAVSLANFTVATTLTSRNEAGAQLVEKGSRWSVVSTPAVSTKASASIAAEASVRHVADCVSFSGGSTTAPALTLLTIQIRDGATGAGTIIWSHTVIVTAAAVQNVSPFTECGLNLVGTTNTAMTAEWSALLTNLFEDISISGFNVN